VGKPTRERALELLELVGLHERMGHRLEELSGGEQQRVAIAIALANKPKLLLADEPTGELDTATAQTIYDLLRDLNKRLGLTVVIVSHDPGIARHVDRIVAVRDGKLASETVRMQKSEAGEHHLVELAVVDAAGRLTIPREHLEKFHIRRRVQIEVIDEGILIRPPEGDHHGQEATASFGEIKPEEPGVAETASSLLERLKRLRQNLKSRFRFPSQNADENTPEGGERL
jgi:ABC-type glutathione transport system ATPase component